jgi:tripartite ATP-independent transporter DctP family solute receptor
MRLSRKQAIGAAAGAFASIGLLRYRGDAAEFSYKLANDTVPTHPLNVATAAAVKRIQDASSGQLEIRVFENAALGSDPQLLSQVRSGAVEFIQVGNDILGAIVPAAALSTMPFAFSSYQQMESATGGAFGAYVAGLAEKAGIRKFENAFYAGLFHTQSRLGAIATPADLKGLKIRVPPGPLAVAMFKAFDASPAPISLAEVYTSLQTHLVDALTVPLPVFEKFKFYEQVKFCSLTSHSYVNYLLLGNLAAWQRLPKNLAEIVDREFARAANEATLSMADQEQNLESTLRGQGMAFNRPALEPFRQVIRNAGLYAQWRQQYDPAAFDLLQKAIGKLA